MTLMVHILAGHLFDEVLELAAHESFLLTGSASNDTGCEFVHRKRREDMLVFT